MEDQHPDDLPEWLEPDETDGLPEDIQRLRAPGPGLTSNLPAMVYQALVEPAWPMVFVSPGARTLTGYPPRSLRPGGSPTFGDLIHPDDADRVWASVLEAVEGRRAFSIEYRITHADGQERHVWDHGHGVHTPDGQLLCVEGAIFDITDRVLLEAQLNHSQRQETIGRLAGVVCHDFNNFLTGIIGSLELGLDRIDETPVAREHIELALTAADRAKALTRQLLLLGKARPPRSRVVDANERLRSLRDFLDQVVGSPVTLSLQLHDGPLWIDIDPSTLDQVVLNLVVNAKEALDGYGTIELRVRERADERGRWVLVEVEDDGCGMDPGTLDHVFDPFFTTKEYGTGLGLATVQGIARDAGGHIDVRSAPGEGTTVGLRLPGVERREEPGRAPRGDDAPASGEPDGEELPVGAGQLVLVVDDDATVLTLMETILSRFGYEVVKANGPDAALERVRELEAPPAVSIIDVSLPRRSGIELASELRELGLIDTVLLMSGYAAPEDSGAFQVLSASGYLEKPFSVAELLQAVRRCLDGGVGSGEEVA